MWILVKSGINGQLDDDSQAWLFDTYEDAFEYLDDDVRSEASERNVFGTDPDEYGSNYDEGTGFCGVYGGVLLRIYEADPM